MSILISVLLIVEVLAAFLLVVVILAQKSKDQGLGMAFGSGMGESLFGSRAGNVLTRMTIVLAAVFMVTTMFMGILFAKGSHGGGSVMDKADSQMPLAPMAAPPQPAPMVEGEMPLAAPSAPIALSMGEDGAAAPAEAVAPAAEESPAPVDAPAAPATETEPAS